MKDNYISPNSPKNKFRAVVYFSRPLKGVGSEQAFGAMSLTDAKILADRAYFSAKAALPVMDKLTAYVEIWENRKEYPSFDWVNCVSYELGKRGGARPGAGRKCDGDSPRVVISARVDAATAAKLRELRSKGRTIGQVLDELVGACTLGK